MTRRLDAPWMSAPATAAVMAALEAAKGQARFVGGCVRDALLGIELGDIDIATTLTPSETVSALEAAGLKAVPTGIEHGTVTAVSQGRPFEITTLRRDVETDGRRAVVAFTTDWAEDAARRDFRLNALYLERSGVLHDPTGGGVADALAGRIVFVGEPETRILEDSLRILRFFRFFAWYGKGAPDAAGLTACKTLASSVDGLSGERLAKELLKLLAAPDPIPAVRLMAGVGVLERFLPLGLSLPRLEAMVALSDDPLLRLAALLPSDKPALIQAASRLRLSNAQRDGLYSAVRDGIAELGAPGSQVRPALYRFGADAVRDRALLGLAGDGRSEVWAPLLQAADAWEAPVFPAGGADLKALGLKSGPEMGMLLRDAEAWWIDQDFRPDRVAVLQHLAVLARGKPDDPPAGYSGKPLAAKLGLKPGGWITALDAPGHYHDLLAPLPQGARVTLAAWGDPMVRPTEVVHAFVRTRAELADRAATLTGLPLAGGALWISWPKKTSSLYLDLTEDGVRAQMLPTGWVDVKVAAVDADWSGLKFLKRRA
jgi:poly(A) polymerase